MGDDRIKQLGSTDTWLLLMAAHTHDLGMVVLSRTIKELWEGDEFDSYLSELMKENDKDIKHSASLLLGLKQQAIPNDYDLISYSLDIRRSLTFVIANYFRSYHHLSSKSIIQQKGPEFGSMFDGFFMNGISGRFVTILGEIAYCHGVDFYKVFDILEFEANGLGNDKMHPRFVAFMLRLGDLLDVDDKRFSDFNIKVLDDNLPQLSAIHKQKHEATKHFLISPGGIEITADCQTDDVYRACRAWFDWLEREVENQSKEWSQISPSNFGGLPPLIGKNKIKVLFRSKIVPAELMNLKFNITEKRAFEILQGDALYNHRGLIFIRELIQNALDATKMEMWKAIKLGNYDFAFKEINFGEIDKNEPIFQKIRFPIHIPNDLWRAFPVHLIITREADNLVIEVIDQGKGISQTDLIRMTSKVGKSEYAQKEKRQEISEMPFFLRPTGAFGIGLQSVFMVVDAFDAESHCNGETLKITFRPASRGEYSSVELLTSQKRNGTTVKLTVPLDVLDTFVPRRLRSDIIYGYDTFDDRFTHLYLSYLNYFIHEDLLQINPLSVSLLGNVLKESLYDLKATKNDNFYWPKALATVQNDNYFAEIFDMYGFWLFKVWETNIGSELNFYFYPSHRIGNHTNTRMDMVYDGFYIRDIKLGIEVTKFTAFSYFKYSWNLQSEESDKILNISRDRLNEETQDKLELLLVNGAMPKVLPDLLRLFETCFKGNKLPDEQARITYFHLLLTCQIFDIHFSLNKGYFANYTLPPNLCLYSNGDGIPYDNFFNEQHFFNITVLKAPHSVNKGLELVMDLWKSVRLLEPAYGVGTVVYDAGYFYAFLIATNYQKISINIFEFNECEVEVTHWAKVNTVAPIVLNEAAMRKFLNADAINPDGRRRTALHPFSQFANDLAVLSKDNAYAFGPKSEPFILHPFKNQKEFKSFKEALKDADLNDEKAALSRVISEQMFKRLVPAKLVDYVKKNMAFDGNKSNQEIEQAYALLILAFLKNNQ